MIWWYDLTPNSPLSVSENDIKAKESGFEYCEFFSCILMSAVLFVFIWTRKKTDPGWIENGWNMNFNILPKNLQRQKYFKSQKVKTQPFYLSANCHLLGPVSFQILCIIIKLKISLILKCSFLGPRGPLRTPLVPVVVVVRNKNSRNLSLFLFLQTLSSRNLSHSTQYTEHWTGSIRGPF